MLLSSDLYIMAFDRKAHWEQIYATKPLEEAGWYQPKPEISLDLINKTELQHDAAIIDIGGGDSLLVDHLIDQGYTDVTVLDISAIAIERAQDRLGEQAKSVKWIIGDVLDLPKDLEFDIWHDRAAFHFLLEKEEIDQYIHLASKSIKAGGFLILGTFSDRGPKMCSGRPICQYSKSEAIGVLSCCFEKIHCYNLDHITPNNSVQNYTFCYFKRIGDEPGQ